MAKVRKNTPSRRQCGTMAVHYRLLEKNPNFRRRQMELEHAVARRMTTAAARRVGPLTIPVVVHIVHNTPAENISVLQIKSQIRVLNKDFRARNTDKKKVPAVWNGLVADAGVQFALA